MRAPDVEWLLDCKPRPVQEEAILRCYYGWTSRNSREAPPFPLPIPNRNGPAIGYGYLMEMRLGKTPTMLNEMLLLDKHQDVKRRIIFSPNTYKNTWVKEVQNFGLLQPVHAFETRKIGKAEEFVDENPDDFILVVNYEAMIQEHVNKFLEKLLTSTSHRTLIAADESIKIKNHTSLITRAAMAHAVEADYVRILTGLPMTQGPQDLYSQFRFVRELNGSNFYAFRNRFCKMGGFKGKKVVGVREDQAENLQKLIEGTAFVAKRKDWGRVTEPEYYSLELELSDAQLKHYIEMDNEMITMLEDGQEISVDQVISKMLKLQQISSGFVYDENGKIVQLMDPTKTAKMKALIDIVEDEVEGKIIIPYHYSASGDLLLDVFKKYNPRTIRGGQWMKTNRRDVDEEKRIFNEDPDCKVMLLQIQAGKYGHTLTGIEGLRCAHMAFFENTYSLDDRTQIEMRNTAETQDWTNVYLDFVSSPVERNAAVALQRKEDIVAAIIGSYNPNKEVRIRNGQ